MQLNLNVIELYANMQICKRNVIEFTYRFCDNVESFFFPSLRALIEANFFL